MWFHKLQGVHGGSKRTRLRAICNKLQVLAHYLPLLSVYLALATRGQSSHAPHCLQRVPLPGRYNALAGLGLRLRRRCGIHHALTPEAERRPRTLSAPLTKMYRNPPTFRIWLMIGLQLHQTGRDCIGRINWLMPKVNSIWPIGIGVRSPWRALAAFANINIKGKCHTGPLRPAASASARPTQ